MHTHTHPFTFTLPKPRPPRASRGPLPTNLQPSTFHLSVYVYGWCLWVGCAPSSLQFTRYPPTPGTVPVKLDKRQEARGRGQQRTDPEQLRRSDAQTRGRSLSWFGAPLFPSNKG
eukprot:scaffold28195_cov112-Isochrysis_galbana.AAC.2